MSLKAFDGSNYTDGLTSENLTLLKTLDYGVGIIQAVDPPAGYPAGQTRPQIRVLLDNYLLVYVYVWLWFDLDAADIARKLALLDGFQGQVKQLYLDVEDNAAASYNQPDTEAKVQAALDLCDAWLETPGGTGIYTSRGYWNDPRYLAGSTKFSDRKLWDANWNSHEATDDFVPYGGWTACAIKQFHGSNTVAGISGIDQNVLSPTEESFARSLMAPPASDPAPESDPRDAQIAALQEQVDGLVNALGYIAGDLAAPIRRYTLVTRIRTFLAGLDAQADQHGIAHS